MLVVSFFCALGAWITGGCCRCFALESNKVANGAMGFLLIFASLLNLGGAGAWNTNAEGEEDTYDDEVTTCSAGCALAIVVGLFSFATGAAFIIFALMPEMAGSSGGKADLEAPASGGAF